MNKLIIALFLALVLTTAIAFKIRQESEDGIDDGLILESGREEGESGEEPEIMEMGVDEQQEEGFEDGTGEFDEEEFGGDEDEEDAVVNDEEDEEGTVEQVSSFPFHKTYFHNTTHSMSGTYLV